MDTHWKSGGQDPVMQFMQDKLEHDNGHISSQFAPQMRGTQVHAFQESQSSMSDDRPRAQILGTFKQIMSNDPEAIDNLEMEAMGMNKNSRRLRDPMQLMNHLDIPEDINFSSQKREE